MASSVACPLVMHLATSMLVPRLRLVILVRAFPPFFAVAARVQVVQDYEKDQKVQRLLEKIMDGSKILIFSETKRNADDITRKLRMQGFPARESAETSICADCSRVCCASRG